jgi:hypothetical protein
MTSIDDFTKCDARLEYHDTTSDIRVIVECELEYGHSDMHVGRTINLGERAAREIRWLGSEKAATSDPIINIFFNGEAFTAAMGAAKETTKKIDEAIRKRTQEGTETASEVASRFSSRRDDGMWAKTTEEYKFPKIDENYNPVKFQPVLSLLECKRCGLPWDERHQKAHDQNWHIFWAMIAIALVAFAVLNVVLQVQG